MTETTDFYSEDLAYIHHHGFPDLIDGASGPLLQELRTRGIEKGLVLDLGCGGGAWAQRLTDAGFGAWGCDISPAMVALARRTAPQAAFEVASLFDATLPTCVAATALGEGFNYGMSGPDPAADLTAPFTRIHDALPPGGLFAFDLVVQEGGATMDYRGWKSGADWAVLIEVQEDRSARNLTRAITIFREVEGHYRRSEEQHAIGIPTSAEVLARLDAAGFEATAHDGYGDYKVMDRRAVFYATRR